MDKSENIRGAMPLQYLIQFWEKRLGEDDPLNPPNPLGDIIQDTIYYLKELSNPTREGEPNKGGEK